MKDNITTIEGVAEMIQRTMASKEDIKDVREDIANVNSRLDRIEPLLLR
jgi:DNA-binding FrmR family transcriptional regulator